MFGLQENFEHFVNIIPRGLKISLIIRAHANIVMRVNRENKVFWSDIETRYGVQGTFSPDEQVNISKIYKGYLLVLPAAMGKHPFVKEQ